MRRRTVSLADKAAAVLDRLARRDATGQLSVSSPVDGTAADGGVGGHVAERRNRT
jgi:hypothetical protein